MYLCLVRHGESVWNKENRFTGWTDVELSDEGIKEAKKAGEIIKNTGIVFDKAYTSYLKRARQTLKYILEETGEPKKIVRAWQLNERHYGALQGLNKDEMRKKYGDEQVHIWRRSYDVRPPKLEEDDPRNPKFNPLFWDIPLEEMPLTESLKDVLERVEPYYKKEILKDLNSGLNILVVAHGNSLRALIKYLENISDEEIPSLELPTGEPILYDIKNTKVNKIDINSLLK